MTIKPEFETLVNRYMDGLATAEEVQLLNERLRTNGKAHRSFAELLNLDSALGALAAEGTFMLPAFPQDAPEHVVGRISSRSVRVPGTDLEIRPTLLAAPGRARNWRSLGAVAAGVLVAVAVAAFVVVRWNPTPAQAAIAQLTGVSEAVWADGASTLVVGDRLGTERLRLKSGTVQITIDSGVILTLVGPAEAEFKGRRCIWQWMLL